MSITLKVGIDEARHLIDTKQGEVKIRACAFTDREYRFYKVTGIKLYQIGTDQIMFDLLSLEDDNAYNRVMRLFVVTVIDARGNEQIILCGETSKFDAIF